jgi:prophage regulatory protein
MNSERKLLRMPQVIERVGMSRSGIYLRIKEGSFAAPVKIGRKSVWDSRAIDDYIDRVAASGSAP